MTNTKHYSFNKKALSVILTVVMAFSYVGLLSGVFGKDLFGTKQTAEAMTSQSQGSYYIRVIAKDVRSGDGWASINYACNNSAGYMVVPTVKHDGTSGPTWYAKVNSGDWDSKAGTFTYYYNGNGKGDSSNQAPVAGFPTELRTVQTNSPTATNWIKNNNRTYDSYYDFYIDISLDNSNWTRVMSVNEHTSNGGNWSDTKAVPAENYPYLNSMSISGNKYATGDGSEKATYTVTEAKDNYGANWCFSSVEWTSNKTAASITNAGVASFGNNNNSDYDVTFTPTLKGGDVSATKSNISVHVYTPRSISYNLNGGSVVNANPTSYNLNTVPTTLNNPTRPGYTFAGWTGSNGSTPQETVVIPRNNIDCGLTATTSNPYNANNRDNTFGNAFSVTSGSVYKIFVTAKRTLGSLDMQGGFWYTSYTAGDPWDGYNGTFTYLRDAGNGWGVYYKYVLVPAGKQAAQFYIQLEQDHNAGIAAWSVADCRVTNASIGNLSFTANWTPINYTATFKADETPDITGTVHNSPHDSTATFNIENSITFPTGANFSKPYYTFDGKWKMYSIGSGECNWTLTDTLYDAGSTHTFGKYGDVTFRAQYTPIDYQIEFVPNPEGCSGAGDVPSNWSTPYSNHYKYNYENRANSDYTLQTTLPATTRLGYTLTGWRPTAAVGNWDPSHVYPAGTSLAGMHGDSTLDIVVLEAVWETVTATVTLDMSEGGSISGNLSLPYAFNSSLVLNNPTRTGYTFKGWKVTAVPNYGSDYNTYPAANRWVIDSNAEMEFPLGNESQVTLPAYRLGNVTLKPVWEHIKYTITYAGNGGSTPAAKDYYIDSTAFALETSTRNGYTFTGWSASPAVGNWSGTYQGGASVSGKWGNVTLIAQWTPSDYTITLDVNGGDALANTTLPYKITESTALPPSPTRTGYTFAGWKVVAPIAGSWVEGTVYSGSSPAAPLGNYGNLKLQAQWTPTDYTISKTTNGGSNSASVTYHINDAAFTLGASELPGYTFQYWTVNANAGNWVKDTKYYADTSISGMWGNVGLTANFTPITYTITYKDKDGETLEEASYKITEPVTIRDYAVDGYTFGGWEVSDFDAATGGGWPGNGEDVSAGTLSANMYYGNITLSPILTAKSYTVTYDFNGAPATCGNLPYTIESTDELPGNASANPPAKTGHDFSGWKVIEVGDEGNWTLNAVVEGNTALTGKYGSVTLQAQWTPKNYTITYITGTYPDGITKPGTYDQLAPDLTDEEKAKPADAQYTYTFDHWEPALATVTGEATYTAVYESTLNKYDITWMIPDDVGGVLTNYTATVTPNVEYGAVPVYNNGVNPELASDNPDEYSWRFIGWATEIGGAKLESIPAVDGTATYYALFTKVLTPEEVNWVIEGVTNTELWGIGETPEWRHDTPTKPDADGYKYTFTHWDPTPVPVVDGITYTYTAQFESSLQDYTITLKLNGGSMSDPLTMDYQKGISVTFPAPEKTGYTFAGWLLDTAVGTWAAGTTVPAGVYDTAGLWGNVSFTAQWTPTQYTISFAQGSVYDELPDAFTYTIESTGTIPAATREGHSLDGWIVTVGDGNWTQGATLAAAYSLLNNYGDITLTPVWKTNTYSISWISGDYTETSEAEYGSAILVYQPRTRAGYTAAWNTAIPETMPAENLTFTAVYTPVEYYVRLYVNGGNALDNFSYTIESNSTLPTPTRDGATFAGWKVTNPSGNWVLNAMMDGGASLNGKYGNVTLTAQWDLETHTVTWIAGDVTKETVWFYGSVPSYDGTPYKAPDESYSYEFTGWDKEIVPVTEDVTYTALFRETVRKYTVIWNVDGTTTTEYYAYGETPVYPGESDPVRLSTNEYDFTFSGWSPAVSEVTADVTYYAQFDVFTKLQGLSIDVSSLFMEIGANTTVNARLYPETATVRDVVWTSRNTEVATIDSTGTVTAVSPGVALINVSSVDKSFNAYCVVTVAPVHTSYLEIKAGGVSTTQLPGAMLQLTAILQPDNATDTGITWSSRDISVATVDNTGLVTFVSEGETDIVAVAADGFSRGSIHVVTTRNEEEVEDSVTTYRITFGEFATGFRFKEEGDVYTTGYCSVPEGETLRFKLDVENAKQANYSVLVNGSRISYGDDYWYALEDVHNNMVITLRSGDAGSNVPQIDNGDNNMSFFQRLAAFFRKIVEFFRGLFNR